MLFHVIFIHFYLYFLSSDSVSTIIHLKMGDQYLCLDQVNNEKVPPPPPTGAVATPVPPEAAPPPAAGPIVKVPAPPPGIQKDIQREKSSTKVDGGEENEKKSSKDKLEPEATGSADNLDQSKGHPTLVRVLIGVTNFIFAVVFAFWLLTLLTGLDMLDIGFINSMFMA